MGDQFSRHFQKHGIDPDVGARIYDISQYLRKFDWILATLNRTVARGWTDYNKAMEKATEIRESDTPRYHGGNKLVRKIAGDYRKKFIKTNEEFQALYERARKALLEASPYLTRKELADHSDELIIAKANAQGIPRSAYLH